MASPTLTYTLTNGTTADATKVQQNFTDLLNGITDTTKDLSISALTCAGAATFNGNVTLGNATADDITVTGSLASTIPIKTTNTYNIGSSTLGLAGIYFGANSQTVRIIGSGSMSATWTMTLPITAGTAGQVLQTNGSGVTSWQPGQTDTNRITGNYIILDTDGYKTIIATAAPAALATFNSTTDVSSANDTVAVTGHGLYTGQPFVTDVTAGGFVAGVVYYAISTIDGTNYATNCSANVFAAATSIANALAGTKHNLTSGSGTTVTVTPGIAVILPTASANTDRRLTIKRAYATTSPMLAIVPEAAGETIDAGVGLTLAGNYDGVSLVCENSVWYVDGTYFQSYRATRAVETLGNDISALGLHITRVGCLVSVMVDVSFDGSIGSGATQVCSSAVPAWARPTTTNVANISYRDTTNEYFLDLIVQTDGDIQLDIIQVDTSGNLAQVAPVANTGPERLMVTYMVTP